MNEKITLATKCRHRLERAILEGELLPGTHLKNEDLKQLLHTALSPIREALSSLAEKGLLDFEENKGYTVAKKSSLELIDSMKTYAEIECLCLQQSIENGNDQWESQIVAALHKLKKLETQKMVEYSLWEPVNREFHAALVAACPIRELLKIRDLCALKHEWFVRLSFHFADSPLMKVNHKQHREIANFALKKKIESAKEALYSHITSSADNLLNNLLRHNIINEQNND